jgi:hypothetical protein
MSTQPAGLFHTTLNFLTHYSYKTSPRRHNSYINTTHTEPSNYAYVIYVQATRSQSMTVQVKCHLITLRRTKEPRICCELSWLKSILHGRWISWLRHLNWISHENMRYSDYITGSTTHKSGFDFWLDGFFLPKAYVSLPGQCAPGINRPKAICWPHPSSGRNSERTEIITDYPRGVVGRVWRGALDSSGDHWAAIGWTERSATKQTENIQDFSSSRVQWASALREYFQDG